MCRKVRDDLQLAQIFILIRPDTSFLFSEIIDAFIFNNTGQHCLYDFFILQLPTIIRPVERPECLHDDIFYIVKRHSDRIRQLHIHLSILRNQYLQQFIFVLRHMISFNSFLITVYSALLIFSAVSASTSGFSSPGVQPAMTGPPS